MGKAPKYNTVRNFLDEIERKDRNYEIEKARFKTTLSR